MSSMQVTNHGIEATLMDAMMDASREFFRQPLQEKRKHSNMIDGKHFQLQGYGNDRVASEDQVLDWCDRLYLLVEPQEDRSLDLWPTCLRCDLPMMLINYSNIILLLGEPRTVCHMHV